MIRALWQKAFLIAKRISTNHHAECYPRVKIPFIECIPRFGFVKSDSLFLRDIIVRQLIKLAQLSGHGILSRVQARFFYRFVNRRSSNTIRSMVKAVYYIL